MCLAAFAGGALLDVFVKLNNDIKYSSVPKYDVEAAIMLFGKGVTEWQVGNDTTGTNH